MSEEKTHLGLWQEVVFKVGTFILTELCREFALTKHLLWARCHVKCFPWIISFVSSHQFCEAGVLAISVPLVGEKRLREGKWLGEHHVPWSWRVRIHIQAVWLQVCAPHLTYRSNLFRAQPCWLSGAKAIRGMGLLHWGPGAELLVSVHIYASVGGVMQIFSFSVPGFITRPGIFQNKFVLVIKYPVFFHKSWVRRSPSSLERIVSGGRKPRPERRDFEGVFWVLPGTRCWGGRWL